LCGRTKFGPSNCLLAVDATNTDSSDSCPLITKVIIYEIINITVDAVFSEPMLHGNAFRRSAWIKITNWSKSHFWWENWQMLKNNKTYSNKNITIRRQYYDISLNIARKRPNICPWGLPVSQILSLNRYTTLKMKTDFKRPRTGTKMHNQMWNRLCRLYNAM